MENNSNISIELEEMRLQMAALQQQLNERIKLDEQQLQKNTIKKKINNINRYGYISLIGIPIAITGFCVVQYRFNISFEFLTFAIVSILLLAGIDFWSANRVRNIDLSSKNVKEIIKTLISMRKINQIGIYVDFIFSFFVLMPLLIHEIYIHSFSHFMFAEGFPTCLFICINSTIFLSILSVGIIFGTRLFKKQQRDITEMIEMLKDKE